MKGGKNESSKDWVTGRVEKGGRKIVLEREKEGRKIGSWRPEKGRIRNVDGSKDWMAWSDVKRYCVSWRMINIALLEG